jgi:magnesium chelatase subunit D
VTTQAPSPADIWREALVAAALVAVAPAALGGLVLRAQAGPVRDAFLEAFKALLPDGTPVAKVPPGIGDERLLGGLDMTATLRAGRPVAERGLLARLDGGLAILPMAERLPTLTVARFTAAMDRHEVVLERDGLTLRMPARVGLLVIDEAVDGDDPIAEPLLDRLAFRVDLRGLSIRDIGLVDHDRDDIAQARACLDARDMDGEATARIVQIADAFGVCSVRAALLTLRAASALAALDGRELATHADLDHAAALVIGPRATRIPAPPPQESDDEPPPPPQDEDQSSAEPPDDREMIDKPLDDMVLEAVLAAMPADVLARLRSGQLIAKQQTSQGGQGQQRKAVQRGRAVGTERGRLDGKMRLHIVDTLRAAVPWQKLRRAATPHHPARVLVRTDDVRVRRFKQSTESVTIFVVDASGSAALHRLAEAKGAVELLLADCYARRDQVALITFRGQAADLVLPPTRALARARRSLAGVPGGGGTPLHAGIDAALELASDVARRGKTANVVFLTDGAANVGRDPAGGRRGAHEDALAAARRLRASGTAALMVDTAPRPQGKAQEIATEMGAVFLALPFADATRLRDAVKAGPGSGGPSRR